MGTLLFAETDEGRNAEQMVARNEIGPISIGYQVDPEGWRITDADGDEVPPESARWKDDNLTFTATKWTRLEASLVAVATDPQAVMRNVDRCMYRKPYPS